jgi:SdrD B-like domain
MTTRRCGMALLGALMAIVALGVGTAPAFADVVFLKVKEGRTVTDPATNAVLADENTVVANPYKWLLMRDVAGDPTDAAADCRPGHGITDPVALGAAYDAVAYPANCSWPSIHAIGPGTAPSIVASGDGSSWSSLQGLTALARGRYMVSVWADGYEVAGGWFEVACGPGDAGCDATAGRTALVYAQRNPIPSSTLRIDVFEDNRPTNGQYDVGPEQGLNGFRATATDPGTGEALTTDLYGNPICSDYEPIMIRNGAGAIVPLLDGDGLTVYQLYNEAGNPVFDSFAADGTVIAGSHAGWETATPKLLPGTGGQCVSHSLTLADPETGDTYEDPGHIVIRNLGPGRWAAQVSPPDNLDWATNPASYDPAWSQTTTLEGNHDWDTWLVEGDNGLDHELVNGGEKTAIPMSGWVQKMDALPVAAAPGSIRGTVIEAFSYTGDPVNGNYIGQNEQSIQNEVGPVDELWVALTALHVPDDGIVSGDLPQQDELVWARSFFDKNAANPLAAGAFEIPNVPPGDYMLSVWDFDQNNILAIQNLTVRPNEVTDVDTLRLAQWWAWVHGTVFEDKNANGRQDAGEPGIPDQLVTVRERSNALYNHGAVAATTDEFGRYRLRSVYPLGQWLVLEQYADGFKTTGVTWQAAHEKTATTETGGAVDLNFLPWIGQGARIDWGKQPYKSDENGGIVGVVAYGTTRNELNPDEAALEDWQPGIPGLPIHLYRPVKDAAGDVLLNADGSVMLEGQAADGSGGTPTDIAPAQITEEWQRPADCPAYDAEGNRTSYPFLADFGLFANALAPTGQRECVEAIGAGMQGGGRIVADGALDWGATVNGNWGFGDQYIDANLPAGSDPGQLDDPANLEPLPAGDYVVKVDIPNDQFGNPIYKPTREEDINVFAGDGFQTPTPSLIVHGCAGATHIVDVAGILPDGPGATENPTFVAEGGSPYEGESRPLCDARLIKLENGRSVAPGFEFFTDVPLPTIHYGLIIDDLNTSVDKEETFYGDKAPAKQMPISWYDFSGRLVRQSVTDPNGKYEVMLPSTNRINYPSPAGVAAGSYTLVANDPSMADPATPDPGAADLDPRPVVPNPDFNPQYRTITTPFETQAGHTTITDLAVMPIGVSVAAPGAQLARPAQCLLDPATPQFFAADRVYTRRPAIADAASWTPAERTFVLRGTGFGASGDVQLVNEEGALPITAPTPATAWTPTEITIRLDLDTQPGPYQVYLRSTVNGQRAINGITLHVLGQGYNPTVREVGPGQEFDPNLTPLLGAPTDATATTIVDAAGPFGAADALAGRSVTITSGPGAGQVRRISANTATTLTVDPPFAQVPTAASTYAVRRARGIQDAINEGLAAMPGDEVEDLPAINLTAAPRLIVVHPNRPGARGFNPRGAYQENLIMPAPMTIQGFGPGGQGASGYVYGSVVDGSHYQLKDGGRYKTNWYALAEAIALAADNPTQIADGQVVYVLTAAGLFGNDSRAAIDGLAIEGGNQLSFPGTLNQNGGGPLPRVLRTLGQPLTQGGGIFVDGHARGLRIRNNVFRSNGGSYGGAIRLGSPYLGPDGNASNDNAGIRIADNQIIASGGTNLGGAIAIFNGADTYEVARNEICGNFSAEYGGGISHYGRSDGGRIHHNRIYFNASFDEGAGIFVAGQLPAPKTFPNLPPAAGRTHGSGAVTIDANVIQSNLANDDGGGIRLLMAGVDRIAITGNQVVNNISTHEGGGIAIDDATNVVVAGNTVMKNITTATAMTSDGAPMPAGLSAGANASWLTDPDDPCAVGHPAVWPACVPTQPDFTPPVIFDNVFWDNRAGSYDNGFVRGIGLPGDTDAVAHWDLDAIGVAAGQRLMPVANIIQDLTGHTDYASPDRGNTAVDPAVNQAYDTTIAVAPFRGDPHWRAGTIVALDVPPTRMGNYKLTAASPMNTGVACVEVTADDHQPSATCAASAGGEIVRLPDRDIDDDARPQGPAVDVGADEYLASTAPIVAMRRRPTGIRLTARVRATRLPAPARMVVGGLAPATISASCRRCTATLQIRRGKRGRILKNTMRRSGSTFRITRRLGPGTYRYRVVIRNRQTGRVHIGAWRTVTISKIRKGTR